MVRRPARAVTVEAERVRGSRFVAHVAPATTEAAALDVVTDVHRRHGDASHVCWALATADGRARSDDGGEPRDTAGPPIARRIEAAGLLDVVVTVTRWFGGTLLGRGGLVRAYGGAAAAGLAATPVVEAPAVVRYRVVHPYDLTAPVAATLAAHTATVTRADHAAEVTLLVDVPRRRADAFVAGLADATAGRVTARAT